MSKYKKNYGQVMLAYYVFSVVTAGFCLVLSKSYGPSVNLLRRDSRPDYQVVN